MRGAHSLVLLWSGADLAVGGFLGNWAGFMSLVILPLSFVRIKLSLDCAFYIRHPGMTILLHSQTPGFYRNSKSPFFPSWTKNAAWILDVAAGAKEAEAKDFPTFQPGKKEDSPPSTKDRSRRKSRQALDEPPNANQECAGIGKRGRKRKWSEVEGSNWDIRGGHLRHYEQLARLLARLGNRGMEVILWQFLIHK